MNFGAAKAEMTATDVPMLDFFTIPNALFRFLDPVSVPATCSFDITWSGPISDRSQVTAPAGSSGELITCQATMQWSASSMGFHFVSDPKAPTTSILAQLGKVTNGVFGD